MAYYRRRGFRRRRYNRYRRNRLSSYRIATRISARSQAKQIWALNRRITNLARETRPQTEICIFQTAQPLNLDFNSQGAVPWKVGDNTTITKIAPPISLGGEATNAFSPKNNLARLRSFTLMGNISIPGKAWRIDPTEAGEGGAANYSNQALSFAIVRITVIQLKYSRATFVGLGDLYSGGPPASSPQVSVYSSAIGPLQNGVSRICNILSDKKYKLDYNHTSCLVNTPIRYLSNYYKDTDSNVTTTTQSTDAGLSSELYEKGSIFVYYTIYSNIRHSDAGEDPLSNQLQVNLIGKLAFTNH